MYQLFCFLAGIIVVYKAAQYYKRRTLVTKFHCKPARISPNKSWLEYLGIASVVHADEMIRKGGLYSEIDGRFKSLDVSTFKSITLGKTTYVTKDIENIRHILSATEMNSWNLGARPIALRPLIGDGIFASEGQSWKHSRIMLRPVFAKEHVKQITSMEPYVQSLIKIIKNHEGEPLEFQTLAHLFTIDYSTDFLLGESCDSLKDFLGEESNSTLDTSLRSAFASQFNKTQQQMTIRFMLGKLAFLMYPKSFQNSIQMQKDFVDEYIDRVVGMSEEELNNHPKSYVLLYQLARQTKNRDILQDELMSILLAGRDTTASLLTFLFFELSHHPEVFNKLKEEIERHFPDVESVTFGTIQRCDYLQWCINETMRLHPSVPFNFRTAANDTVIPRGGGKSCTDPILVHKGEQVLFSFYSVNREEKYFGTNTDKFAPERWSESLRRTEFIPFSAGPRACLGQQLARVEASYVTIRLLQTFHGLHNASKQYPPNRVVAATMRLTDGCNVCFI
ncbi:Cytochrome P450 52C1 [Candida tropicalis]